MNIFISHASDDKDLADCLKQLLETEFLGVSCWVSSNPAAIPMGKAWFSEVIKEITKADIMIVLLTPQSVNRMWVGFEAGMFWEKVTSGSNLEQKISPPKIFVLTTGLSNIPSPLDQLQSGVLSVSSNLEVFIDEFSRQVGVSRARKADINIFVQKAQQLTDFHYRSILKTYPTRDAWKEIHDGDITRWYCKLDSRIVLEIDWNEGNDIQRKWTKKILNPINKTQPVIIKLNGIKVGTQLFMSLDEDRIFVPYPKEEAKRGKNGTISLKKSWDLNLDALLLYQIIGRIIGSWTTLEELAKWLKFKIIK